MQGRALGFFFRVPPMYPTFSGPNGYALAARVPPGVLAAPFPLNIVPADLDDASNLFAGKPLRESFDTVALSGPGRDAFQAPVNAALYDMALAALPAASDPLPDLRALPLAGNIERMSFELLNGEGIGSISTRETVPDNHGFLSLQGWAILVSNESSLLVEVGGKLFRTRGNDPAGVLRSDTNTVRLVEIPVSGGPHRIGARSITFRIEHR